MTRVGSNKSICFVWRMLERLCESNVHLLCATEENASLNTSTCLYFLSPTTHFFHLVFFSPLFLITLVKNPLQWIPDITFDAHTFFVLIFHVFVTVPKIQNEEGCKEPFLCGYNTAAFAGALEKIHSMLKHLL